MTSANYTSVQRDARDRAQTALGRLLDLVINFPFQSPLDQSVWLAGLLTVVARAVCMPAPFFLVCGGRDTGKALLCDLVAVLATGLPAPRLRQATGNADQRLQVLHTARRGAALVVVDDLARPLGNAKLDEALASAVWRVRFLGKSEVTTVPLTTVWWGTGSAARFDPKHDTERRTLVIQLEEGERHELEAGERHLRELRRPDPLGDVLANRNLLIQDAMAIVDGWEECRAAPRSFAPTSWGPYDAWCETVREAVMWLGMPDPVGARLDNRERHRVPKELLVEGQHPPGLG